VIDLSVAGKQVPLMAKVGARVEILNQVWGYSTDPMTNVVMKPGGSDADEFHRVPLAADVAVAPEHPRVSGRLAGAYLSTATINRCIHEAGRAGGADGEQLAEEAGHHADETPCANCTGILRPKPKPFCNGTPMP